MAATCQGGASNERRVAMALVEAIDECRTEGVNPREDAAVFLIAHQLTFLLTEHDFVLGDDRLFNRFNNSLKAIDETNP